MRPNCPSKVRASARTSSVLPRPGTPSISTCPPAMRAASTCSTISRCPTTAFAISARIAVSARTAWARLSGGMLDCDMDPPGAHLMDILGGVAASARQPLVDPLEHAHAADELGDRARRLRREDLARIFGREAERVRETLLALARRKRRKIRVRAQQPAQRGLARRLGEPG